MDTIEQVPQQSITPPATHHSHIRPMLLVGVVMLLIGLGGGYFLFGKKATSPQNSNRVTQVVPSTIELVSPTTNIDDNNTDEELVSVNFQIYRPEQIIGRFQLKGYESNPFSDPPFIEYTFSPSMAMFVYKAPSYFNPPQNCGQVMPGTPDLETGFSCQFAITTPKGHTIYSYSQEEGPQAKPESYFTRIGDTVISFDVSYEDYTKQEIGAIVDTLSPTTLDSLKKFNQKTNELFDATAKQSVTFDIYKPTYIPPGFALNRYFLGNNQNIKNPDFGIEFNAKDGPLSPFYIDEFKPKKTFNPPDDCGENSAEFDDIEAQFNTQKPCSLLVTTPKGIYIYVTDNDNYFMLGATKVSISPAIPDKKILSTFVDSLVKTSLNQIPLQ